MVLIPPLFDDKKWVYLRRGFEKKLQKMLVGTAGFEPATPCPPDKYATRLRYAPNRIATESQRVAIINEKRQGRLHLARISDNKIKV